MRRVLFFILLWSNHSNVECVLKDVVFVLDRSGSVSESDFNEGVEFLKNVVDYFTIGAQDIQISVVSYSDNERLEFALNAYLSKPALLTAIENLKGTTTDGSTYTGEALQYIQSTVLQTSNGARPQAETAVVVLTDGQSNGDVDPGTMADSLRADGAEMFSVGVGTPNFTQLQSIANDPASFYVMYVSDFVYLCNLVPALVPKLDSSLTATLQAECASDPSTTTPWPTSSTSTTTSSVTAKQEGGYDRLSPGTVAGIVVAVILFTVCIGLSAVAVWLWKFKLGKKKTVRMSYVPGVGLVAQEI